MNNFPLKEYEKYTKIYHPESGVNTCCEQCVNCIDGCSWSRDFKPVDGWKLRINHRNVRKDNRADDLSTKILWCPQFEYGDASKGRKYNDERMDALFIAVVEDSADEYREAYRKKLRAERELAHSNSKARETKALEDIREAERIMQMHENGYLDGYTDRLKRQVEQEGEEAKRKRREICRT